MSLLDQPLVVEVTLADARNGRPRSCTTCAIAQALLRQRWVVWATVLQDWIEIVTADRRIVLPIPADLAAWINWYDSLPTALFPRHAIVPCVMPLPLPTITIPPLSDARWEGVAA
jgi:hypothetical protein